MTRTERLSTYFFFTLVAALSAGMLYLLNNLSDSAVIFMLGFYKNAVEIFFSNSLYYFDEESLRYVGDGFYIGRECLGLNITALIFLLIGLLGVRRRRGAPGRLLWICTGAAASVIIGVAANLLRLLSSIYFTAYASFELIHALLGIVIYLSVIILCFRFLDLPRGRSTEGGGDVEAHI